MVSISDGLGIESLVVDLNQHFKATKMGRFSTRIFNSPSFLSFLQSVIKYQNIVRTNNTGKLEILGPLSKFSVFIDEPPSRGKLIAEQIGLMRILDAFRMIGGKNYVPVALGITSPNFYILETVLPKGNYTLKVGQRENWILFETAMLSKETPSLMHSSGLDIIDSTNPYFTFKIEMLLNSFNPGFIPKLNEIAEMLNVSTRTIERNLQAEGTNFLHVKDQHLQRKAYELIANPSLSINDIAEQLDFRYGQNFTRRFKKWTGISPTKYRAALS